jgi:hypothetical protein
MSEFLWPPPDDELDLTAAPPGVKVRKRRRHNASSRRERRRPPEQGKPASFAWPPAESDLSAPADVEAPEAAFHFSPGAIKLDRGPTFPRVDRTTSAAPTSNRWRVAVRLGSRRLVMFTSALLLALVVGTTWQVADRWSTIPQQPRSSASTTADPRPPAEAIDVAPPPSPTRIPADRSPVEGQREPKALAEATPRKSEPEAPTSPTDARAAAPRAADQRRGRAPSPLPTRPPVERPSETVIASAAIGADLPPPTASREDALARPRGPQRGSRVGVARRGPYPQLTPLVEPSLPAPAPSAPVSATTRPAAKPVADADPRVTTSERASRSPAAGSRSAPALDEDHEAIERLVNRYQAAFDQRDADAAAAVWPSVDGPALARAFADVQQQDLTLDRCDVAVEEQQATASCPGALSYVRRVGPSDPQVARHVWTFLLERHERGWLIAEVTAR